MKFSKKLCKSLSIILAIAITFSNITIFQNVPYAYASTIKLNKSDLTLQVDDTFQYKVSGTKAKPTFSSSDKKVATVSKSGLVKAKSVGVSIITVKVNKKTFVNTVEVYENDNADEPNFEVYMSDETEEDTLYVGMSITNYGDSTLRIYSESAALIDSEEDSFCRLLRLADLDEYDDIIYPKYCDIKPGKTETVIFEVIGGTTWYDEESTIFYYVSYEGMVHLYMSSYSDGSAMCK